MDISFVTSANTDKEAQSLLIELGLPFKKSDFKSKLSELKNIKTENTVIKDEAPVVEDTVEDDEAPVVEESSSEKENKTE